MNSRQLLILAAVAIAIITGATWLGATRNSATEQSAALYPTLKGQLGKVDRIQVYAAGDQLALELARSAGGWSVRQRNDYPADANKVNTFLITLQDAKIREQKTSNPEHYATLNVQDLKSPGATGARVELKGVEPPVNLIIGKEDTLTRGSYARRANEKESWLLSTSIEAATDPAAWLQRDALNVAADRIQEVSVAVAGNSPYNIVKATRADVNFGVTGLPKGREIDSVSATNAIAQTLVSLQLDDVRPVAEIAGEKSAAQTRFRTFDGLVISLDGYVKDNKRWVVAKANFDEALAQRFATEKATDKTPTTSTTAKGREEVEAINKKLGSWAIAIADYKYDNLFKPLDQLLKK